MTPRPILHLQEAPTPRVLEVLIEQQLRRLESIDDTLQQILALSVGYEAPGTHPEHVADEGFDDPFSEEEDSDGV
ncbi:MAG: hypothetical protein FJX77_00040 [Armatimonadetes bacterium]|nr:hypothetical protein [Armatimonadota bacterium]